VDPKTELLELALRSGLKVFTLMLEERSHGDLIVEKLDAGLSLQRPFVRDVTFGGRCRTV
jgi:hypothetical protein